MRVLMHDEYLINIIRWRSRFDCLQIRQGVHVAFRTILEKRVVQSLSPILDNPKLDLELRGLIRSNLQEFCASASADGSKYEEFR